MAGSGRIEARLFASGTNGTIEATASLTVIEPGPTSVTVTLSAPSLVTDALTSWQAALNASALAGTYTLAWDTSAGAMTISATGVASFEIQFSGDLHTALGFVGSSGYTGSTSYTGDTQASARFDGLRISSGAITPGNRAQLLEYSHGRSRSIAWGTCDLWTGRVLLSDATAATFLASYAAAGYARLYQCSDTTAYSATNPDGYLDGHVVSVRAVDLYSQSQWVCEVVLAIPRTAPTLSASSNVWAPLQFGWGVLYYLTIEGLDLVLHEFDELTLTLPTGYATGVSGLVVGDSARIGAVIDPDAGVASGFPLSFGALDAPSISSLFMRPDAVTTLSADLTSSATTITVASTADFDASGAAWVGRERFTYTGKTATTFTGCTRGTLGYAYPHKSTGGGALVTNAPRYWKGRHVTLHAVPITPTGFVPGSALDDDASVVWRGFLDREPVRRSQGDGWEFSAQSLDRLLDRPLAGVLTGEVLDVEPKFSLGDTQCAITVEVFDSSAATLFKYAFQWEVLPNASAGDIVGISQWNASCVSQFAAEVTAHTAGGDVNGLDIVQQPTTSQSGGIDIIQKGSWVPILRLAANANAAALKVSCYWAGKTVASPNALVYGGTVALPYGLEANQPVYLNVAYAWSPYQLTTTSPSAPFVQPYCTVRFDSDPGTLPSTGTLTIGDSVWEYESVGQTPDASTVAFGGAMTPLKQVAGFAGLVGSTAEIRLSTTGTLAQVARRLLSSSGESGLRDATYDTLPTRLGYGLPSALIDGDEIDDVLTEGWLSAAQFTVTPSDEPLADILGGVLALSGRALVVTDDGEGDTMLRAVHVSAAAGGYAAQVTDSDLVAVPEAVVSQRHRDNPARITVELVAGGEVVHHIGIADDSRGDVDGLEGLTFRVPSGDRVAVAPLAAAWGFARVVGEARTQVIEVDTVPWLEVRPGDSVDVQITEPSTWNPATGAPGYTGRARVIGRELTRRPIRQRLTLWVEGQSVGTALCPAAPVTAFAGTAANPTTIDIPAGFFPEIARDLEAVGGNIRLLHYEPGQGAEGTSEGYTISAAQVTAGVCRLTVATKIGTPTLATATSYLTWPETANADDYQDTFAHDADGTRWI